jgi:hypothetical protein
LGKPEPNTNFRGGFMKKPILILCAVFIFLSVSSLTAGEAILYGGFQKPGKLSFDTATEVPEDLLKGDRGSVMGIRFSGGRVIGYEQNIGYSPRFGKPGVKALQMDSNLLLQAPGSFVPDATAGIGYIKTWGQGDFPTDSDPQKIAAFAFSFGTSFSLNYGGGIKVRKLAGPLGLNIDVRGYTIPNARADSLRFIQTSFGLVITY